MGAANSTLAPTGAIRRVKRFCGELSPGLGEFETEAGPHVTSATPGDHVSVFPFLTAVFQGPTHDTFQSSLDDPFYEPRDRLLIKDRHRILSHLHLAKRTMQFGALRLPVAAIRWVGTLPEYRGRGFASRLLQLADQCMEEDGSTLGWLTTKIPHFFRPAGWAVCGRHCVSRANPRDVLAQLIRQPNQGLLETRSTLTIRPWRQVELPSVMRLYRQRFATAYGALERTEPYWRWLISRKAFDQIYVAIEGPDRFELDDGNAPIVGYAVTRGDRVLELVTQPGRDDAGEQLLARVCGEALEHDATTVTLFAPPDERLHALLHRAPGQAWHHESYNGEVMMARVLDPVGLLRDLCGELQRRADRHRLPRPCELSLVCGEHRLRLTISRRSVKVSRDKPGRGVLRFNEAEFTRLLLGHTDVDEAVAQGRIHASNHAAQAIGRVLFEPQPLWRPPLDELDR